MTAVCFGVSHARGGVSESLEAWQTRFAPAYDEDGRSRDGPLNGSVRMIETE